MGEPTGLLACPSGMDPKRRCHPARRPALSPVVSLALLLSLGACGTTTASPGGGSTLPEDPVTSVVGDGPLNGTTSTAAPIPQAPPPGTFRTRSDVVAAAVRAAGIPQPPTGLVLESSRTPELGFDTAEQKQAWTAGRVTLGPGWSRDSPGAAQIRFADGTSQPVDALDAQAALDAALAPSPDACSGLDPAACTLTFTNGSMTTVKVTTNRGQATVPAWSFQAAGLSHPVVVVAVPSGILQDAPAPTPPSGLPDPEPGLASVETSPGTPASTSGSSLTVAIGHGACDRELHAHVVEYADLVVAGATFAPPQPGSACTSQLIVTPATLTLSRPLGDRPVISVTTGVAIPVRR